MCICLPRTLDFIEAKEFIIYWWLWFLVFYAVVFVVCCVSTSLVTMADTTHGHCDVAKRQPKMKPYCRLAVELSIWFGVDQAIQRTESMKMKSFTWTVGVARLILNTQRGLKRASGVKKEHSLIVDPHLAPFNCIAFGGIGSISFCDNWW